MLYHHILCIVFCSLFCVLRILPLTLFCVICILCIMSFASRSDRGRVRLSVYMELTWLWVEQWACLGGRSGNSGFSYTVLLQLTYLSCALTGKESRLTGTSHYLLSVLVVGFRLVCQTMQRLMVHTSLNLLSCFHVVSWACCCCLAFAEYCGAHFSLLMFWLPDWVFLLQVLLLGCVTFWSYASLCLVIGWSFTWGQSINIR